MLNKIYEEQKTTNRNLQRISNVILMAVFAGLGINAKEHGNDVAYGIVSDGGIARVVDSNRYL